jgi:hypothetical protein
VNYSKNTQSAQACFATLEFSSYVMVFAMKKSWVCYVTIWTLF